LQASDLEHCRLVYDRAALIAMGSESRPRYYAHMLGVLPRDCDMLLIAIEYDQQEMQGPPFSVPTAEILQYYREYFSIKLLETNSIIDERPRWRAAGLRALQESVISLTR
jgi:thiopurine S-methyltransferase